MRKCLRIGAVLVMAGLAACTAPNPSLSGQDTASAVAGPAAANQAVVAATLQIAVIKRGWHTEIALPWAALSGPVAELGPAGLHPRYVVVGFGARDYFTDTQAGMDKAIVALISAPSAINLAAFSEIAPSDGPERAVVWLSVTPAQVTQMEHFLWAALPHEGENPPQPIVIRAPESMFYNARPGYHMFYNCNNWAIDILRAGDLPFHKSGVHFSEDVQVQAQEIAAAAKVP